MNPTPDPSILVPNPFRRPRGRRGPARSPIAALGAALPAALLAAVVAHGGDVVEPGEDPLVPDEALIRLDPDVELADVLATLNDLFPGTSVDGAIESRRTYRLLLPAGANEESVEDALDELTASGDLVWGELNYEGQAAEGKTDSLWVSQLDVGVLQYDGQYAVELLGLPTARAASTGQGVVVAVLDTGVDATHPRLKGRVLEGVSFIPAAPHGAVDIGDGADNDGDGLTDEMVGHGTFVAGLVNLVAPEATLLPVVVLDSDGIGDTFSIAQGIYHAIDHGARIINCSFGSTYKGEAIEDAVLEAWQAGIVVVGAAGNFNREEPEEFPALITEPLGVGSTDDDDHKAPFSNYNDKLALCAPGHSVQIGGQFDPDASVISTLPGGGYGIWRGTSFSTALVSGAAALVRAQHPQWPDQTSTTLAITSILTSTAMPLDALNPAYEEMLGSGRLDVAAAVALGPPAPAPGDLDGNGVVNGSDLGVLLAAWGECGAPGQCAADLDVDGDVDGGDLGILLGHWG